MYSVLLRFNSFHKLYYFVLFGHCGYGSLLCGAERTAGVGEHCHFKDIVAVKLLGGFAKFKELVEKCSEEAVARTQGIDGFYLICGISLDAL